MIWQLFIRQIIKQVSPMPIVMNHMGIRKSNNHTLNWHWSEKSIWYRWNHFAPFVEKENVFVVTEIGPVSITQVRRILSYLLDQIDKQTSVYADLKPPSQNTISKSYRFSTTWFSNIITPWVVVPLTKTAQSSVYLRLPLQWSSDLFQAINDEDRMEKEYWAFDITSISIYSEAL